VDEEFLNADEDDFETDELDGDEVAKEVDDDPDEVESKPKSKRAKAAAERDDQSEDNYLAPEVNQPPPSPSDHVERVYEYGALKRTIDREFTAEEAEAFASEYNRTARAYGRFAVASKAKSRAKKSVPWPLYHGPTEKA